MTRDANQDGLIVGVAGAGAMGRGIAQVAAGGGCKVKLYDSKDGAPAEAKEFINKMLGRNVEKGRMAQEDAERAVARIEVVEGMSGLADCDCVVEAVVENLEIKHAVFKELESVVAETAILATNTSSLSVSTIASACERPGRVAGMHFFNPVPLMKLVEIVDGVLTEAAVGDFLMVL